MAEQCIDITGLDKAELLAALYNRARPQGMGFLHYDPAPWTSKEAQEAINDPLNDCGFPRRGGNLSFDYLRGRVMKVNLEGDTLYTGAYDRDNGQGAAAEAVAKVRGKAVQR